MEGCLKTKKYSVIGSFKKWSDFKQKLIEKISQSVKHLKWTIAVNTARQQQPTTDSILGGLQTVIGTPVLQFNLHCLLHSNFEVAGSYSKLLKEQSKKDEVDTDPYKS